MPKSPSVRLTIMDGLNPLLDEVVKVNANVALEMLSVAGNAIKDGARESMRSKTNKWYFNADKNSLYKGNARELGLRVSGARSMANLITSNLMESKFTVVVGGRHEAKTVNIRRNGKIVGTDRLFGVNGSNHAILHKLEFGERLDLYNRDVRNEEILEKTKFKGHGFMREGLNRSKARVNEALTRRYKEVFNTSVANITVERKAVS